MIFSAEKWNDGDEIRDYISVSTALNFSTVMAPLKNAFDLFLLPLLGEETTNELTNIYKDSSPEEKKKRFLSLAQRANSFLAFWYDYDEMNVSIGSSGVKRQDSEKAKTPYKYQEKNLRDGWKTKGFNALDDMLSFLEENIKDFSSYEKSTSYTCSKTDIIRNTRDVNEIYFINNSRLVFLRLKSHFKVVEDTMIAPRFNNIFLELKEELKKESPAEKFVKLQLALKPVIVFYAVQRLLLETGNLSDKGLFFSSVRGGEDSAESFRPVSDERVTAQARQAEKDASAYWKLVEKVLQTEFSMEILSGNKTHYRDNTNKKSFWT